MGREPPGALVSILVVCAVAQELAALAPRDGRRGRRGRRRARRGCGRHGARARARRLRRGRSTPASPAAFATAARSATRVVCSREDYAELGLEDGTAFPLPGGLELVRHVDADPGLLQPFLDRTRAGDRRARRDVGDRDEHDRARARAGAPLPRRRRVDGRLRGAARRSARPAFRPSRSAACRIWSANGNRADGIFAPERRPPSQRSTLCSTFSHRYDANLSDKRYTLAYSPCPNDTFIFAALANGLLDGAPAVDVVLDDVEALNLAAREGRYELTKVSYGAIPVSARQATASCAPAARSGAVAGRWSSRCPASTRSAPLLTDFARGREVRDPGPHDDRVRAAAAGARTRAGDRRDALRPHRRRRRERRGRRRADHPRVALHLPRAGLEEVHRPGRLVGARDGSRRSRSARSSCAATSPTTTRARSTTRSGAACASRASARARSSGTCASTRSRWTTR